MTELARFPNAEIVWCQEEPKNQGAWAFVQPYLEWVLEQIGRPIAVRAMSGARRRPRPRPASCPST